MNFVNPHSLAESNGDIPLQSFKRRADSLAIEDSESRHLSSFSPRFKFSVLLLQLVYQSLFPLSLPLMLLVEGRQQCENQLMLPSISGKHPASKIVSYLILCLINCSLLTAYVCFIVFSFTVDDAHIVGYNFVKGALIISVGAHLLRCLVIATKYAFMSADDYMALKKPVSAEWFNSHHLLAWVQPTATSVMRQIELAALRLSIDPTPEAFHYNFAGKPDDHEKKLRRKLLSPSILSAITRSCPQFTMRTKGRLPGILLCTAVTLKACKSKSSPFKWGFIMFLPQHAVVVAVSLWTSFDLYKDFFQYTSGVIVFIAGQLVYVFSCCMIFSFLLAGMIDYKRRARILRYLDRLVSFRRTIKRRFDTAAVVSDAPNPVLCVQHDPMNLQCYIRARNILKSFGLAFQLRIQAYTIYVGLSSVILLAAFVGEYLHILSSFVDYALGVASCLLMSSIMVLFLGIINYGIKIQESLQFANENLLAIQLNIRGCYEQAISAVPPEGLQSPAQSVHHRCEESRSGSSYDVLNPVGFSTASSHNSQQRQRASPQPPQGVAKSNSLVKSSGFAVIPFPGETRHAYKLRLDQMDKLLFTGRKMFSSMAKLQPVKAFGICCSNQLLGSMAGVGASMALLFLRFLLQGGNS